MAPIITTSEKHNPFPGLRPFAPEENEFFFGRESESEEIAGKLVTNRFVAVTGARGSGKSSLIYCGVMPRLRSVSPKIAIWRFISLKPGSDPLGSITQAFAEAAVYSQQERYDYGELLKLFSGHPDAITEAVKMLSFKANEKILLVIDQFDELFRYGSLGQDALPGSDVLKFVNLLTNAITGRNQNIYIAIAIRSDFISECAQNKSFTHLINNSNFLVPGMSKENIREVIEGPVRKEGAEIDSDLVEILIEDIRERSDYLPFLQHALMRTWTRWKELGEPQRPISYYDYDSIGTIKDAVSRHADEVFESLSDGEKVLCEKLFKLITGKSPGNQGARYPLTFESIKAALKCPGEELSAVMEKFRDPSVAILTPLVGKPVQDNSVIDLSHESLIYYWSRLKRWIDEEAESVQMYLRLSEMSAMYQQGKTGLLKQPELQLAVNWRELNKPALEWAQRYNPAFERAMVYLRTSEKDYLEAEERKIKQHKGRLRRIRIISSVFGGIAILTVLSMIALSISKISSDNQRKESEMEKVELNTQKNLAEEYAALALRRSIESDSIASATALRELEERKLREEFEDKAFTAELGLSSAEATARSATEQKIEVQRLRMISLARSMALRSLQVSGQKDLQSLLAYQAYLFNKRNNGFANDADIYHGLYAVAKQYGNANYRNFSGHEGGIRSIAFVPGKNEFFTSGSDGRVLRWNLSDREQDFQIIYSDSEITDVLAVSPDAEWLACGKENAAIRMIPLKGNDEGYELNGHSGKIKSLVFSFDGRNLYSAALDGKVLKWDLSVRTSTDMATDMMQITSIDLSYGDKYIAGVSTDGKALVWDPEGAANKFRIESAGRSIRAVKFKPGDEQIAVGYDDGTVEFWDLLSKSKVAEFKAHTGEINGIRFSNSSPQMATAGADGMLKLWDMDNLSNLPVSFADNGGLVLSLEFSLDGTVIISGSTGSNNNLVGRPAFADVFAADGCSYVSRNFTPSEWISYVGSDIDFENTCPGAEYKIRIREIR